MNNKEFAVIRRELDKTQQKLADILGISIKAIHSYEQGWRTIPPAVERQMYFLVSRINSKGKSSKPCWKIKSCTPERKKQCPAWEFKSGNLCWFINGTICDGNIHKNWNDKMKICRSCEVFNDIF